MKGVLLVNMGGAKSSKELKTFLLNMFRDPHILPFGKFTRNLLSIIISNVRYKKSWIKYDMIGGSPIIDATTQTMLALQKKLGANFSVKIAFSYSSPFINQSLESYISESINEVTVIPLYPQASFTTTSSVEHDVYDAALKTSGIKIHFIKEFYQREGFVNFWTSLISEHTRKNDYSDPCLLFSAHSIPAFQVNKGDTYPQAIESTARAIADRSGCRYELAYQSGMSSGKWIGPDIKNSLKRLAEKDTDEIVIIPVSFVNENLETLYDIDYEIIPYGRMEAGIEHISRVEIPVVHPIFIDLLAEIAQEYTD